MNTGTNKRASPLDRAIQGIYCYHDLNRVYHDADALLKRISSLQPLNGNFTYDNGTTSTLVYVAGTIPIFYNGQQYNIPIEMWIPENYPRASPRLYVRPTNDMMIKPGHHNVNPNGLVSIPYLSNWNPQTHQLVVLISHACSVFGKVPPVFRRPGNMPMPVNTWASPTTGENQRPSSNASQNQPRRKELIDGATKRIQHELHKTYKKICEAMDFQLESQQRMNQGKTVIHKGIISLRQHETDLKEAIRSIQDKDEQVTLWLKEYAEKSQTDTDVADILEPQDTWSRQMFEAMAEHNAIEDMLYHMDRALANGEIELDMFLKEVRKLSRKQFMHIALMQVIVEQQRIHR